MKKSPKAHTAPADPTVFSLNSDIVFCSGWLASQSVTAKAICCIYGPGGVLHANPRSGQFHCLEKPNLGVAEREFFLFGFLIDFGKLSQLSFQY